MSCFVFNRRSSPLSEEYIRKMRLPERLPFTKMEGLGNDYVYVWLDDLDSPLTDPGPLAMSLADRNFGVGGDGMILVGRSSLGSDADFRMRMFNVDGTEGEMCGNATRCVGKYVYDRGLTDKTNVTLETAGGTRVLSLDLKDGKVDSVRVDMGRPRLNPAELPMIADGDTFINREIIVDGARYAGTAVSMGNPHFVVLIQGVNGLNLREFGPKFEHHHCFPRRANIEFVEVVNRKRLHMRVWERGSGETLACGSGASAALVACALNGLTERTAVVELRGGELLIEWDETSDIVYMTGPAREIFSGEFLVRGF